MPRRSAERTFYSRTFSGDRDHHDKPSSRAACHDRPHGDAIRKRAFTGTDRADGACAGASRARGQGQEGAAEGSSACRRSAGASGSAAARRSTSAAEAHSATAACGCATAEACSAAAKTRAPAGASSACAATRCCTEGSTATAATPGGRSHAPIDTSSATAAATIAHGSGHRSAVGGHATRTNATAGTSDHDGSDGNADTCRAYGCADHRAGSAEGPARNWQAGSGRAGGNADAGTASRSDNDTAAGRRRHHNPAPAGAYRAASGCSGDGCSGRFTHSGCAAAEAGRDSHSGTRRGACPCTRCSACGSDHYANRHANPEPRRADRAARRRAEFRAPPAATGHHAASRGAGSHRSRAQADRARRGRATADQARILPRPAAGGAGGRPHGHHRAGPRHLP